MKIMDFEQLERMKQREAEKAAEVYTSKPFPPVPVASMRQKIDSMNTKRKTIKFEISDRQYHRKNIFTWKSSALM
jgi:hypothetical protein